MPSGPGRVILAVACGAALLLPSTQDPAVAGIPDFTSVAALGDSLTDTGIRGPNYAENICGQLGVPLVNLARGGTTSATLLSQGQHTRAVDTYHATFAFLWIGGNDMLAAHRSGQLLTSGATEWIDTFAANYTTALDTLLAGGANVITANLIDLSITPYGAAYIARAHMPIVRANIQNFNARLASIAESRGVPVVDWFGRWEDVLAAPPMAYGRHVSNTIGDPLQGNLWADLIHPNPLGNAILTNFFIEAMDSYWGLSLSPVPLPEPATFVFASVSAAWCLLRRR